MVGQADERKPQHGTVLQVERAGALRLKELLDLTRLGRRIERSQVEFLPVRRPRVTDDLQRERHSLRASESRPQISWRRTTVSTADRSRATWRLPEIRTEP